MGVIGVRKLIGSTDAMSLKLVDGAPATGCGMKLSGQLWPTGQEMMRSEMGRREDDLQPAGLSHESAIGFLADGPGKEARSRMALRPGFRKEAFVPVGFGATQAWAEEHVLLAQIQERMEELRTKEGASWLEVRWGEDGWWKKLHTQERGEQGLRLTIGNDRTVDLVEHQVLSVGEIKDGSFKVMSVESTLLLEVKAVVTMTRTRGGRVTVEQVDAKQARQEHKIVVVNDIRVEWRTLGRKLDEYLLEFTDRHADPMQAFYIASRGGELNYFEATAVAARIEALIAWLGVPGRETLKRVELPSGRGVSSRTLMRAAARARLHPEDGSLRFRVREVLEMIEADVEERDTLSMGGKRS